MSNQIATPDQQAIIDALPKEVVLTKETLKNGYHVYRSIAPDGRVMGQRKSKRDYVAGNGDLSLMFGRADLIGKGEHARLLRMISGHGSFIAQQFAWRMRTIAHLAKVN
jgi:hypothetical protein